MKIIIFYYLIICRHIIRCTLIFLFSFLLILPTMAEQIEPEKDNISLETVHGVPVINIATPNQAGVSHNLYHQFNIGEEGAILNNNMHPEMRTQLAGKIASNPHLHRQPADIIINEVISANPSVLKGQLEVAGHPANVMVANPYGITCNGCSFINTPGATLTSGKPLFDNRGRLSAVDVTQGDITLSGTAVDASQIDCFALISHAMKINSKIHAKKLNLIAGNNRVNSNGSLVVDSNSSHTAQLAIDSGALGGMYADRIKLVSTGQGVAVNLANLFVSQDIHLEANGKISVHNMVSQHDINASGDELHLTGKQLALGNMTLNSHGDSLFDNAMLRADENNLTIKVGGRLTSKDSTISAGGSSPTAIVNQGTIDLHGHDLIFHNTDTSTSMLKINSARNLTQDKTSRLAARELYMTGRQLDLNGRLFAIEHLYLNTQDLQGSKTASISSQNTLTLDLGGDSGWAGEMVANKNLLITGKNLINYGMLMSMEDLHLTVDHLANHGHLQSNNLHISANQWYHQGAATALKNSKIDVLNQLNNHGQLISGKRATLNIEQLNNTGYIEAKQLDLKGKMLTNSGTLLGQHHLQLKLSNNIYNQGELLARDKSGVTAAMFNNRKLWHADQRQLNAKPLHNSGQIQGATNVDLTVIDTLSQNENGSLTSRETLILNAPHIDNHGTLHSQELTVDGISWFNRGKVEVKQNARVNLTHQLTNYDDLLAIGDLHLTAAHLTNHGHLQGNNLHVTSSLWNNPGSAKATENIDVSGLDLLNNRGQLMSAGLGVDRTRKLINHGTITTHHIRLNGRQLSDSHDILSNYGSVTELEPLLPTETAMPPAD